MASKKKKKMMIAMVMSVETNKTGQVQNGLRRL